jgi:hypothetical protein
MAPLAAKFKHAANHPKRRMNGGLRIGSARLRHCPPVPPAIPPAGGRQEQDTDTGTRAMRKTLVAVAFAGAALAPAAAVTVAATVATAVAPTAAEAAPGNHYGQHRRLQVQRPPLVRRPRFHPRRCALPRVSVRREMNRLHAAGYRHVRYAGRNYYRPRCAMFINFNACRGVTRYRVKVRYIRSQRFVIALNNGSCVINYRPPERYRHK